MENFNLCVDFLIGRQERVEKIDFQHVVSKSKHRRIKISADLPSTKTLKLNRCMDIKNFRHTISCSSI